MTTSSSLSSAVSASFHPKRYDVFISFRGEDTRSGFTSHLRDALIRKQIQTYMDDRLNKGDEISAALFKAIEDSHISIIVFSKNFATSKWCLDELLKILECKNKGQDVIPVFYKVDPSNVRKQKRSFEEAFAKHEREFSNNQVKLTKWKQALFEAANIAGWDSRIYEDESKLLCKIVEDVLKKLEHKYPRRESKCIFGIKENVAPIESLLKEFQIIGIWGMGGMGKTTIAKWLFDKYSPQYEGSCFLANIRENFRNDKKALRDELISMLLDDHEKTNNLESYVVWRRLYCKRIFIVLDDVSASKQLEYLAGKLQCFGSNSRIIITTRDKHVLLCKGVDKIHNVKPLKLEESLQLFSLNAFNQNHPVMGYGELSNRVVDYAQGIPLVLKVLGSFLCSKSEKEWECALEKLQRIPNEEIHSLLKLSYDGLNHEEREIFLDIACFLKGQRKDHVISLLDSYDFYAEIGIRSLQDKALITIEHDAIQMHDLIQEMGWEIVRQESIKEPGGRSRLWDPKEVYDVLKNKRGTDKVEGILLNMSEIRDLQLNVDTFKKMSKLRFVKFCSSYGYSSLHLPSMDVELFADGLKYVQWDGFRSKSLSLMFCPEKLVELSMRGSHLEKLWDGVQNLGNLKRIILSGSKSLVELPDLSLSLNLEEVDLFRCVSLRNVHPSILSLHSLVSLNLYGCKKLKSLESESHLQSLKFLKLDGCSSLKKFSVSSEEMRRLQLQGTRVKMLSSSIGRFRKLECLILEGLRVKNLPRELSCLRNLKELRILDACKLMIHKQELEVIFCGLQSLRALHLRDCSYLFELPDNISVLSSLYVLNLCGSNIECLPTSIKKLANLEHLILSRCKRLVSLPDLPQSVREIVLSGSNVECLPISIKQLENLEGLNLRDCKRLQSIPKLPISIKWVHLNGTKIMCWPLRLNKLELTNLSLGDIEHVPTSFKQFTKLKYLSLIDCKRLVSLPELPLSIIGLHLTGSNIEFLPACINQLTNLNNIQLRDCERLQSLPELPQSVRNLDVNNCTSLKRIASTVWKGKREFRYDFRNCVNLDAHVASSIWEDTYFSIKESKDRGLSICLPGGKVPEWFEDNRIVGDSITIEADRPWQAKAFAFCIVLSPFSSNEDEYSLSVVSSQDIGMPLPLGTCGDIIYWYKFEGVRELNSDHVHLWSTLPFASFPKSKLNCELSFEFLVSGGSGKPHRDIRIKECAVCPIYE
ncbi:TMV resistance protein N-like [Abrus precatorius]|uniref:TMV resistance protein N-like n=1 Tax=Abrus precatorius TaxID=3816 RepID=A0A8B8L0I1_ABRPR|nr:TMV resistance protein N-like [Abrus precatorius]